MRGGFLHNQVLIGSLRREAQRHGAIINDEVRVTTDDGATGFIDLVITAGPRRIACDGTSPRQTARTPTNSGSWLPTSESHGRLAVSSCAARRAGFDPKYSF